MRRIPTMATAVVLACGACQPLPDASLAAPTAGQPQPAPTASAQPPAVQPSCTSYTVPVTVGGQPQQAVVKPANKPTGAGGSPRPRRDCRRRSTRFRRRRIPRTPLRIHIPTSPLLGIGQGLLIGVGGTLPGFSASHRRSSSYSASTISTMASLTALGTASPIMASVMGLPQAMEAAWPAGIASGVARTDQTTGAAPGSLADQGLPPDVPTSVRRHVGRRGRVFN